MVRAYFESREQNYQQCEGFGVNSDENFNFCVLIKAETKKYSRASLKRETLYKSSFMVLFLVEWTVLKMLLHQEERRHHCNPSNPVRI